MSVFKGLNRSDVYLTDYNSKKWWSVPGTCLSQFKIKILRGTERPPGYCSRPEDVHTVYGPALGTFGVSSSYETGSYNEVAVFGSVREMYYASRPEDIPSYVKEYDQTGSARVVPNIPRTILNGSASYASDLYLQTSFTVSGSRVLPNKAYRDAESNVPEQDKNYFGTGVTVVSFPREIIGTGISPETFKIDLDKDNQCYVEDDYVEEDYFEDLHTGPLVDYEGVLIYSGFTGYWEENEEFTYPVPISQENRVVGDIIYSHGQVIITDAFLKFLFDRWDAENYTWQSNWPKFTKHFTCRVQDTDYNYTLNPTAREKMSECVSEEKPFTPYITSLGLYNEKKELLAVAKFSKPIKKPSDADMTFDIQIDLG